MSPPTTSTGTVDEAQLYGGARDGTDIIVPLTESGLPLVYRYAGQDYHYDGTLADLRARYSLPWCRVHPPGIFGNG